MTSNNDVPVRVNAMSTSRPDLQIPDALTEVTAAEHLHDSESLTTYGPKDVFPDKSLGVGAQETSKDVITASLTAERSINVDVTHEPELTAIDMKSYDHLYSLRSTLETSKMH